MAAWLEYVFDFINDGASASVYIHGYADNEAVAYSAVAYALPGEAYTPLALAKMTVDNVTRHVDGTVARNITVQNLAPFNPCAVDVNIIAESY